METKTVTAKPRKLKGTWTVETEPEHTVEELEKKYRELYDKWCWETGSDEDLERLKELEVTINFHKARDGKMGEIAEQFAKEIQKEIDNEILKDLMKIAKK